MIDTSLSDYAAVDTASRGASRALANNGVPLRSASRCAPALKLRRFKLICAFGGCGLWICVVCIRSGEDFRKYFCPLGVNGL